MAGIDVHDLTVTLADGSRLVDAVSFRVEPGRTLGVVGESGSGKSTLSLALLGYARPGARVTGGDVRIGGTDILTLPDAALRAARGDRIAYVPQDPSTALNPSLSIRTQLTEAFGGSASQQTARLREVLAAVDLPWDEAFLKRAASELSGGQKQRVGLAMAVIGDPDVLVLDEPTTGLDVTTQAKVLELVTELCRANEMAAIYISHDIAVIAEVADDIAVMYAGQFVEKGPTHAVITRPIHPYTQALLASVPSARARLGLQSIAGRAPRPAPPTVGCRFADRCPLATEACRTGSPRLEAVPLEWAAGREARCFRVDAAVATPRTRGTVVPAANVLAGTTDPLLEVRGLTAGYNGRQVLFDVGVDVWPGQCVAIVGESGSGKSTMSQCVAGLQVRWGGTVRLDGTELAPSAVRRSATQRREVQYVFQNPYASLNPRATVGASISLPLRHFFHLDRAATDRRIAEVLDRVEMPADTAGMYPSELSGGQRQRVAIARALACEPRLLICDEVTSALDVSVQAAVVELLRGLLADGLSMLFVTHNLAVVRSLTDWTMVLNKGVTVEHGVTETVLDRPTADYTRRLLEDVLDVPEASVA